MTKWHIKTTERDIKLMCEILNIDEVTAIVLANRGLDTKNKALKHLNPLTVYLTDPVENGMKDFGKAVGLVAQAISRGDKIVVFGDYDVDGITSTAILMKTLLHLGASVTYLIPNREEDGYGLNERLVRKMRDDGCDLLLTCDNGIASAAEISLAKQLGMTVVVIDHHEPPHIDGTESLPCADAIVDPKQADCSYPFREFCAAGLSYKFSRGLFEYFNSEFTYNDEFLILAMIATICDVVELMGENRIFAKNGLDLLNKNKRINMGLFALIEQRQLTYKKIGIYEIGYIIGPCINATGRLDNASVAVNLLLERTTETVNQLAQKLILLNEERKQLTANTVEDCYKQILESDMSSDAVYVIYDENIHESIAGIVAGRIKELTFHPVIVLTKGMFDQSPIAKGSARSIPPYNIFGALSCNKDLFIRFGGHAMAAGMSLLYENVAVLRKRLNESCTLHEDDFTPVINIDCELSLAMITLELAKNLEILQPFGKGYHEPLFVTYNAHISHIKLIEAKNTMILTIRRNNGLFLKALLFFRRDELPGIAAVFGLDTAERIGDSLTLRNDLVLDILYSLEVNTYNGTDNVSMKIKEYRPSAEEK